MKSAKQWRIDAPGVIYNAYPGSDLLGAGPPGDHKTIRHYQSSADNSGDGLFAFLLREAGDGPHDTITAEEYLARLEAAANDIAEVTVAVEAYIEARI